ncbi:MAG: hypothetical protein R2856_37210 [Caldilineaceae bacterium]
MELHLPVDAELDEAFWLVNVAGEIYTHPPAEEGQSICFESVPAGSYTLSGNGYWQPGIDVHEREMAVVTLPPLSPAWEWRVDEQSVTEGGEGILIHVLGRGDLPITILDEEGKRCVSPPPAPSRTRPSRPGSINCPRRTISWSPGLDAEAIVTLTMGRRATVTFRRSGVSAGLSRIAYRSLSDPT